MASRKTPSIVSMETIVHPGEPDLLHVLLRDDAGSVGLGETHGQRSAVAALLADLGPTLAGVAASPAAVADVASRGPYGAHRAGGGVSVESRAASALDIAIWDLCARREGVSLADAVGGLRRSAVPTYVTCTASDQATFADDPAALAREVFADGFALVKVWPFAAGRDLDADVDWVRRLVDEGIGVAVDLSVRSVSAIRWTICRLLDPLGLAWIGTPSRYRAGRDPRARTLAWRRRSVPVSASREATRSRASSTAAAWVTATSMSPGAAASRR